MTDGKESIRAAQREKLEMTIRHEPAMVVAVSQPRGSNNTLSRSGPHSAGAAPVVLSSLDAGRARRTGAANFSRTFDRNSVRDIFVSHSLGGSRA